MGQTPQDVSKKMESAECSSTLAPSCSSVGFRVNDFLPTPARGNANDISEFLKQKEKRDSYCARCLSTSHITTAVSTAEREIKGDIARKKIDIVRSKGGEGGGTR